MKDGIKTIKAIITAVRKKELCFRAAQRILFELLNVLNLEPDNAYKLNDMDINDLTMEDIIDICVNGI